MAVDLDHLHPTVMRPRVDAFLADPAIKALGIYVISGYRSPDYQAVLYNQAILQYGSPAAAGKWVAPPWHSDHGPVLSDDGHRVPYGPNQGGKWGGAVDIAIPGYPAVKGQWPADIEVKVHGIAAMHGLFFPYTWEDWHAEPIVGWVPKAAPSQPEEEEEMTRTNAVAPSWGKIVNGRAPFFQLVSGTASDVKAFNVISYNDARLDRVDGVFNGLWFLHQEDTTGPAIQILEKDGLILVLCQGGGVYKVADPNSNGQPK